MKNKILPLLVLVALSFSLFGCQSTTSNPISDDVFNMTFKTLNLEAGTADFVILGYPNEEEKKQINTVVIDSLAPYEIQTKVEVNLYSQYQDLKEEPMYGTLIYKDGSITQDNSKIPDEATYLEYANV